MQASVAICCASASDALAGSVTAKQDDLATNIPETQIQSCHTHDIRSFCKIARTTLSIFAPAREVAYCLQENVQRQLHKTPHGVCRIE